MARRSLERSWLRFEDMSIMSTEVRLWDSSIERVSSGLEEVVDGSCSALHGPRSVFGFTTAFLEHELAAAWDVLPPMVSDIRTLDALRVRAITSGFACPDFAVRHAAL